MSYDMVTIMLNEHITERKHVLCRLIISPDPCTVPVLRIESPTEDIRVAKPSDERHTREAPHKLHVLWSLASLPTLTVPRHWQGRNAEALIWWPD